MGLEVSASILSADFGKLAEAVALCERCGVTRIHVDVMDGHFVPNITIGPVVVQSLRQYTKLPVAAHLMIEAPWDYIAAFADAGADIISVQVECYGQLRTSQYPREVDAIDSARLLRDIEAIRAKGKKPGVVINPGTPVECLKDVLGAVDNIVVMSVNPGFAGQKFMPVALAKIAWLRAQGFAGDIAVDGGVNLKTAPDVVKAGANVLVTASYFFSSEDPAGAVRGLKSLAPARASGKAPGVRAQAIMEYILVMVVVVGVVFIAFRNSPSGILGQTANTANAYFDVGSTAIMGGYYDGSTMVRVEPAPVNGGWCRPTKCIGEAGGEGHTVRECACPRPAFGGAPCAGEAVQPCP